MTTKEDLILGIRVAFPPDKLPQVKARRLKSCELKFLFDKYGFPKNHLDVPQNLFAQNADAVFFLDSFLLAYYLGAFCLASMELSNMKSDLLPE